MIDTIIIYAGNDNVLDLIGLKNQISDVFINDSSVAVVLVDEFYAEVVGENWPLAMSYVAASDGNYRATLPDVLEIIADKQYTAKITANSGADLLGYWEVPLTCKTRTE